MCLGHDLLLKSVRVFPLTTDGVEFDLISLTEYKGDISESSCLYSNLI